MRCKLYLIAITYSLKYGIDRERPNGGSHSFPSGHTSAAFHGAGFIHRRYGLEYGLPAYAAASFVGYSRVHADKHYVSDVVAGALIGFGSAYYFTDRYERLSVMPVAGREYQGVELTYVW